MSNVLRPVAFVFGIFATLATAACGNSSTSSASVSAIAISPSPCTVSHAGSNQLSASATLPDGTKKDITKEPGATWSTDNSGTATVTPTGNVVGAGTGVTKITVSYEGATGSIECTVSP